MTTNRFDHLWRTMLTAQISAQKRARLIGRHANEFVRDMYRFTVSHLAAVRDFPEQYKAMIASQGKTMQQWMDDSFELFERMNDTRERLIAAIEAGVTEREYIAESSVNIIRKRTQAKQLSHRDDGVIPQPSDAPLTDAERADQFRDLYESMKSKYQAVRHELRITKQELGRNEVRLRKMERTIQRLKKDIETFYSQQATA